MTSNFTAAELRELADIVPLANFDEIHKVMAALREYAALKEAAEKGVTDEVVEIALSTWDINWRSSEIDGINLRDMRAALLAVAPLLALMKVNNKRARCMHGDGCTDPDCEGSWK